MKYKEEGKKLRDGGKEREIVVLEVDGTIIHLSKQQSWWDYIIRT